MAFIEANQRTIEALKKADQLTLDENYGVTADLNQANISLFETSTPPIKQQQVSGISLEGEFVPMMSGDIFYCTIWLPTIGQKAISEWAGYAINETIECRTASFRPSGNYCIEACFAYTSEGWVGSGQYGSDADFRHSWMLASQEFHKTSGNVYYEPICYLLSGETEYNVIPTRWPLSIELKGVWT